MDLNNEIVVSKTEQIEAILETITPKLKDVLPKHLDAERFKRIVVTAVKKNPKLLECDPGSFLGAVMQAAQLGLEPNSPLQLAHLIPFKKEVQLIVDYRGYVELGFRSGVLNDVRAVVVYSNDEFEYVEGLVPKLYHKPQLSEDRGKPVAVYGIAGLANQGMTWLVMPIHAVYRIRDNSAGYKMALKYKGSNPWLDYEESMIKKTVLRQLFKLIPKTERLSDLLAYENNVDVGRAPKVVIKKGEIIEMEEIVEQTKEVDQPSENVSNELEKKLNERNQSAV